MWPLAWSGSTKQAGEKPDLLEIFGQGNALPVFKTRIGNIGMLICQDCMFGELVRVLALKGAEIIVQIFVHLTCYTGPSDEVEDDVLKCMTRAHARESGVYIVACNKCGVERFQHADRQFEIVFQGESHIADPLGKLIARGKIQEPDLVVAELDTEFVEKARWTTKYWRDLRPELLTPLTRMSVTLGEPG